MQQQAALACEDGFRAPHALPLPRRRRRTLRDVRLWAPYAVTTASVSEIPPTQSGHIEHEWRFLLREAAIPLDPLDWTFVSESSIVDNWFVPNEVASKHDHEAWIARQENVPARIRLVTSKGEPCVSTFEVKKSSGGDFSTNLEVSTRVSDPKSLHLILKLLGLRRIATTRRRRRAFESQAFSGMSLFQDIYEEPKPSYIVIELESQTREPLPDAERIVQAAFPSTALDRLSRSAAMFAIDRILSQASHQDGESGEKSK